MTAVKSRPACQEEVHELNTGDRRLLVRQYIPKVPNDLGRTVLVAPATAVRQRFYRHFCRELATHGFHTFSFDFRMIGDSQVDDLKACQDTFIDWGRKDFPAVLEFIEQRLPNQEIHCIGHSAGAWLLTINPSHNKIKRLLAVNSMSGYWGNIGAPDKYHQLFLWTVATPILTRLFGYTPGWMGLGHDISSAFIRKWASWNLKPEFLFGDPELEDQWVHKDYAGEIDVFLIEDDHWATEVAVKDLYDRFSCPVRYHKLELTHKPVGHFGFFRSQFKQVYWPRALEWLKG